MEECVNDPTKLITTEVYVHVSVSGLIKIEHLPDHEITNDEVIEKIKDQVNIDELCIYDLYFDNNEV